MHILYLGYLVDESIFDKICKIDHDASAASHKYESCLVRHLCRMADENNEIEIVSFVPAVKNINENLAESKNDYHINYVVSYRNKITSIVKAVHKAKEIISEWLVKTSGMDRIAISYATNPILLSAFFSSKKCKVVTICPEVPKLRIMTNGNVIINRIKKFAFEFFNRKMDGYIFVSKFMNELCNKKGKPWIVVEGMIDVNQNNITVVKRNNVLFYAGGLFPEYGIDTLVEAFQKTSLGIKLVLCGDGTSREKIMEYSRKDSRIVFLGTLTNSEVIELERKATLLINPRKSDNIISKYSFPSKTFEYFASGTPCIITKLEGIPDEYYDYCYMCDASTPEVLARDIELVLHIPETERQEKAMAAYNFLKNEKSAEMQTKRIVDFLKKVVREP